MSANKSPHFLHWTIKVVVMTMKVTRSNLIYYDIIIPITV